MYSFWCFVSCCFVSLLIHSQAHADPSVEGSSNAVEEPKLNSTVYQVNKVSKGSHFDAIFRVSPIHARYQSKSFEKLLPSKKVVCLSFLLLILLLCL